MFACSRNYVHLCGARSIWFLNKRTIMSIRNATTSGVKLTKNVQYVIYARSIFFLTRTIISIKECSKIKIHLSRLQFICSQFICVHKQSSNRLIYVPLHGALTVNHIRSVATRYSKKQLNYPYFQTITILSIRCFFYSQNINVLVLKIHLINFCNVRYYRESGIWYRAIN